MSKAAEVIESEVRAIESKAEAELKCRHEALDALAGTNHRMVRGTNKRKSPTPNKVIDAAIIKYLEGREKPAKAKYIASAMQRQIGVGYKTVYRSLNRLTERGVLMETTGGKHHKRWTVNHPAPQTTETTTPVETVKTPFYSTPLGM